jgi:hypothetical protein
VRIAETKAAAPLEKKEKRADADRISYRQERVEETVMAFVQHLLAEDSDLLDTNVFAHLVDVGVLIETTWALLISLICDAVLCRRVCLRI